MLHPCAVVTHAQRADPVPSSTVTQAAQLAAPRNVFVLVRTAIISKTATNDKCFHAVHRPNHSLFVWTLQILGHTGQYPQPLFRAAPSKAQVVPYRYCIATA